MWTRTGKRRTRCCLRIFRTITSSSRWINFMEYFPEPKIKRELNSCPPITNLSSFMIISISVVCVIYLAASFRWETSVCFWPTASSRCETSVCFWPAASFRYVVSLLVCCLLLLCKDAQDRMRLMCRTDHHSGRH